MAATQNVRVEIFDQVYHLRVKDSSDAEQIEKAAQYVDTKIRAVAANTRDVDSLRLAVLAALHIADELKALESRYEEVVASVERRSNALGRLLDDEIAS